MDIASINERITEHQQEHSMGMAAYLVLEELIESGAFNKSTVDRIVSALSAAIQAEADARSIKHEKERWSAVATDIARLTRRD